MKSLRLQLLLGTTGGTTAVLLASGILLYALIQRNVWAEFDASLAAKARSLTALTEQEGDGLDFELAEITLPEFESSDHAEYYQLWLPDGSIFARSPSLLADHLDQFASALDVPSFRSVPLPDGRPGRLVALTFVPRQEASGVQSHPPMAVTLVLGRDIVGLQAVLSRVRDLLIGVCLVAVALSAGILAWVVRRSLTPLHTLGRQIAHVGEQNLGIRIDAARFPIELSPVICRLNDLLVRLGVAFERERRFTGDVAHELRTPLAGMRTRLELTLSRDRAPEDYRAATDDCLKINHHMERMVENLLHLARADAGQLEVRREQIDLGQIVREAWELLEDTARRRGLRVHWRLNAPDTVETDVDKMRLVVQNILDNAVTYVDENGSIDLSTTIDDGTARLTVANTGCSLSSAEVRQVFDRFWRNDSSHHETAEGRCGLGLSLCKAVIQQLGGSIDARASADGLFSISVVLASVEMSGRDART